ncbi:MAG: ATP/GTP-binding protein [Candidatus Paracaedibacteraceae bacterium]|nr:ATP/GTP-binding protein [Candidatus Paracaedibacteraceae bacterium]
MSDILDFSKLALHRRDLAKTISVLESDAAADKAIADDIVRQAFDHVQNHYSGRVIAVTGMPGAGKSTFIDVFGLHLAQQGHKVAVLAVDPSSQLTFGAIMGDKTRMLDLGRHPNAYIRPSPSGAGYLGGVSAKTEDVVLLLKAVGFDYIFIETIGVGQNESDVSLFADQVIMLVPPATGDEIQALKRGNIEFIDLILINKHDGDTRASAEAAASSYRSSLGANAKIILISSLEKTGLDAVALSLQAMPCRLKNERSLMRYRLERSLLSELLDVPEVCAIYDESLGVNVPTRDKMRIFMNNLKKLLTKAC